MNDSPLNTTFQIREEKSFLTNFGTPSNFKKLMEKPATVAVEKFNRRPHVNLKDKSNARFNNNMYEYNNMNENSITFQSPLPMNRNLQRNKFNNHSPLYASPIKSFKSPKLYQLSTHQRPFEERSINENKFQTPVTSNFYMLQDRDATSIGRQQRKKFEDPRNGMDTFATSSPVPYKYNISSDGDSSPVSMNLIIPQKEPEVKFVMKKFGPILDENGNVMMSSAKRKQERERQMQESGVVSDEIFQKCRDQVLIDALNLRLKIEKENAEDKATGRIPIATVSDNINSQQEKAIEQRDPNEKIVLSKGLIMIKEGLAKYHEEKMAEENREKLAEAARKAERMKTPAYVRPRPTVTAPKSNAKSTVKSAQTPRESNLQKSAISNRWK